MIKETLNRCIAENIKRRKYYWLILFKVCLLFELYYRKESQNLVSKEIITSKTADI